MDTITTTTRPRGVRLAARVSMWLLRMLAIIAIKIKRVDFKVVDADIVPRKGRVVIALAEHTSLSDAIFMVAAIPRAWTGIGMAELRDRDEWPWIIGRAFDFLGHIPIVRGDATSGNEVFAQGVSVLKHDHPLCMWPDGKQVHRGKMEWYPGFARFAKTTRSPIYLVKFTGQEDFWPTNPDDGGPQDINWQAKVRGACVKVLDPADLDKYPVEEIVELTKRVYTNLIVPD